MLAFVDDPAAVEFVVSCYSPLAPHTRWIHDLMNALGNEYEFESAPGVHMPALPEKAPPPADEPIETTAEKSVEPEKDG